MTHQQLSTQLRNALLLDDPMLLRAVAEDVAGALQDKPTPSALTGKYGEVLAPFVAMMERELHANAGKGDRPGWLGMTRETALLELYYHLAKLQKASKDKDAPRILEHSADVANMAMMLLDVCVGIEEAVFLTDSRAVAA